MYRRSWRPENQLELWDLATAKKIKDIPWNVGAAKTGAEHCQLYATQFSKVDKGRFIAAGGSGSNEAKIFDHGNEDALLSLIHI